MPAFALSSKPRAIAGSIAPDASRRRAFLPDSSSPLDPVDLTTSPDTKPAKRASASASLVPPYFSPRKSKIRSDGSEESLPTPPPTSSVHGADADDGIEEVSDSEFTAEELERSARKARTRNIPSSSNVHSSASERSPAPRRPSPARSRTPRQPSPMKSKAGSKSRSASPTKGARQQTLDDLFNTQQEQQKADETPKAAPKRRRRVAASDDEDVPLSVSRGKVPAADSDDDTPLSVRGGGKGKARAIVPASDDDPHVSSHDNAIDLCSSDPVEPYDAPPAPDSPAPEFDDYDDVAFPWDCIPDEPAYLSPAPAPLVPAEPAPKKRPRQSIFDLPDFALEPASQVARSRSASPLPVPDAADPVAAPVDAVSTRAASSKSGKGKLPAVKFADFRLLTELDEPVRAFYEQHWRRGAGDEEDEWHERDQLAFSAAPPKRKAPVRRGGWFKRARGRGRR